MVHSITGSRVATIYKRNSTYWVRFQWHGTEVRRSARTSSKATAQQFLAQLLDEHHRLDRGGRPRRTYEEALERFAHDYLPTLKPMTQVRYRTSFRQLAATFGTLYLDQITRGRLADYASARMKGGTKGATVRRDLAALSCLCSCAVAWDYIDTNPVKQFSTRHIRESAPRTTYPTAEQVDRLVTKASPMAGRIIRFLAETGMRQEEVCGLEWSQVSIPRREVGLTKTKTSSPRVVPLSDAALGTSRRPMCSGMTTDNDTRISPVPSARSLGALVYHSAAMICGIILHRCLLSRRAI
jgi:integrase/recombinase XerD